MREATVYPPGDLYTLVVPPAHEFDDGVASGIVLVHGLTGFMDAGSGGRLAIKHILENLENRPVAYFHIDGLYDYRARRPRTLFDSDHYESMDLPHLTLSEVTDAEGQKFLLLHGVEPDLGWQSVVRSIIELIRKYGVRLTVGIHAIPWPAPHTRPVEITAHSSDPELLGLHQPWVGQVEIPGSMSGLIELNLGQQKLPAVGYAAHVPHYLANSDYPKAAIALIDQIALNTGLVIPRDDLRQSAIEIDEQINQQVSAVAENREVVESLEQQHDDVMQSRRELTATPEGNLISGDELAAALEQYLADLDEKKSED
ncbi:MAG: PAC2 family protein [Actinobacteria bacterium]|nr:PAC2 family protein [Actinomycetota bacterium]